jgi:HlyD family secretion protein
MAVSKSDLDAARARAQSAQAKAMVAQNAYQLTKTGPRQEDVDAAIAQTEAGQAQVALLEQRLQDAELKAPVAGIVRSRLIEVGDMVSPQKSAFTLALTQPKWVRIYVPETDLSRIHAGDAMQVRVDGVNQPLNGTVGYISSMAEFTPKTVQTEELRTSLVYEVRVQVDDPNNVLRLGMPATVTLKAVH